MTHHHESVALPGGSRGLLCGLRWRVQGEGVGNLVEWIVMTFVVVKQTT